MLFFSPLQYRRWCCDLDRGVVPDGLLKALAQEEMQKSLNTQTSPKSQDSTPAASPAVSVEAVEQQFTGQPIAARHHSAQSLGQQHSGQLVEQHPGQFVRQQHPGQHSGQLVGQPHSGLPRRQDFGQLSRQASMTVSGQQVLTSMHRGSRSFEEMGSRSSSSSSSSLASSVVYRAGSVPNLTASSSTESLARLGGNYLVPQASSSNTLMYRDFDQQESSPLDSTGFTPQQLASLGDVVSATDKAAGNIPTLVSHRSLPLAVSQPSRATWTWGSGGESGSVACASYPVTCASSVTRTPSSTHPSGPQAFRGGVFGAGAGSVSSAASCTVTSGSLADANPEAVGDRSVPYYQRPRSSSDLVRKVTSSTAVSSSLSPSPAASSLSQQNLPRQLNPSVTTSYTAGSQDLFASISDSVATCLTLQSSAPQDSTPVCVSSELTASISEPIPQWYSFLDDLESAASLSARRGAFSDAGTPGSSRTRSGPGTPSSVDSPYSQQVPQQQQQQTDGTDGNIPNIISDLLGPNPPS